MAGSTSKTSDLALSPPRTTTTITRSTTPTNPVRIPVRHKPREHTHSPRPYRHHGDRRHSPTPHRPRDVHAPDAIPPAVAALLALTTIPPQKASRSVRHSRAPGDKPMTVEAIIERSQESEKELSLTLSRNPMDLLLSAPEDLEMDDGCVCDYNIGSVLSTRTVSLGSMPSLGDSFTTAPPSSVETPFLAPRSKKSQPTRRPLEPVSSPPGELEDHPLSSCQIDIEELDFRVFDDSPTSEIKPEMRLPFQPLKSAFKSNLTASLRALRQAARSFSGLNFPSIPPEDFLTRSILTLDPQVPYTDERRPPPLEEEPTAALRRYLNPTSEARIEQPGPPPPVAAVRPYTASIQMQTYKVHRARATSPPAGRFPRPSPVVSPTGNNTSRTGGGGGSATTTDRSSSAPPPPPPPLPGPRQREMRENSDFIRIAVMEMAMRKRGKLDDRRPGRARWALPPRRAGPRPYEVGADGVPARWIGVTCSST